MEPGERTRARSRSRPWLVAILVVLVAIGSAYAYYVVTFESTTRACTLAGAAGTPVADSPEAAFDAWFASWTVEWAGSDSSSYGGAPPERSDFDRVGDHAWEWRFTDDRSVRVDVSEGRVSGDPGRPYGPGEWAVSGVNQCSLS